MKSRLAARAAFAAAAMFAPDDVAARSVPTLDTEDAELGSEEAGAARFHPVLAIDVRNGDFARGGYDDDAANLARLPVHLQLGFGWEVHHAGDGTPDAWLVAVSSNGLHSPARFEAVRPRAWYESNNLLAAVVEPAKGLRTALAYTIKTSPNAVSGTSHEASASIAYEGERGIGILRPSFVATVRPKGGHGLYTQIGIEPGMPITGGDEPARLSMPLVFGVGWRGFYQAGTGTVRYGSAGLAFSQPFTLAAAHWRLNIQALALIRDGTLRRLGRADAETDAVVPLSTVGVTLAF